MAFKDKILVAVDASERCMETIRHITNETRFKKSTWSCIMFLSPCRIFTGTSKWSRKAGGP